MQERELEDQFDRTSPYRLLHRVARRLFVERVGLVGDLASLLLGFRRHLHEIRLYRPPVARRRGHRGKPRHLVGHEIRHGVRLQPRLEVVLASGTRLEYEAAPEKSARKRALAEGAVEVARRRCREHRERGLYDVLSALRLVGAGGLGARRMDSAGRREDAQHQAPERFGGGRAVAVALQLAKHRVVLVELAKERRRVEERILEALSRGDVLYDGRRHADVRGEVLYHLSGVVLAGRGAGERDYVEVWVCVAGADELASRQVGEEHEGAREGKHAIRTVGREHHVFGELVHEAGHIEERLVDRALVLGRGRLLGGRRGLVAAGRQGDGRDHVASGGIAARHLLVERGKRKLAGLEGREAPHVDVFGASPEVALAHDGHELAEVGANRGGTRREAVEEVQKPVVGQLRHALYGRNAAYYGVLARFVHKRTESGASAVAREIAVLNSDPLDKEFRLPRELHKMRQHRILKPLFFGDVFHGYSISYLGRQGKGQGCPASRTRPGGEGVKVPGPQTSKSRNLAYWGPRTLHVKPLGL